MSRPDVYTNTPEDAARYERHHAVDDYDDPGLFELEWDEPDDWFAAVMDDEPDDRAGTLEQSWDVQQLPTPAELRLIWPRTVVLCALAGLVFGLLILAGERVVCRMDQAAYGRGIHPYCSDAQQVQP